MLLEKALLRQQHLHCDLKNKKEAALKIWKWNVLGKGMGIASAIGGNKLGTFEW